MRFERVMCVCMGIRSWSSVDDFSQSVPLFAPPSFLHASKLSSLSYHVSPVQMPVGSGTEFVGAVDLVTMTAVLYQAGRDGLSRVRASSR